MARINCATFRGKMPKSCLPNAESRMNQPFSGKSETGCLRQLEHERGYRQRLIDCIAIVRCDSLPPVEADCEKFWRQTLECAPTVREKDSSQSTRLRYCVLV